ncbi:Wzz/FepE/Etk N-terminal domain-containing protein [Phenylobacterium sp. LjRoot164]|uniref:Wzz/FepE/Etk N-terminal domain-containing protein n=1 Tax=unclassified Phenylobacterium TaxID=2640670 RepID=UPI003ED0CCAF
MSIIQFLRILWARRWVTIAATVSCVLGAFIVTLIVPPRYSAYSRVMMDLVKPDPVTGQVTAAPSFARAYTKTQIELIKDYRVAGQVVEDLGWLQDPNLITQYDMRGPGDDRDFRRWAAQRVIDGTGASLIEGSNILEISYTSNSPESARTVADALRKAYIDTSLAFRRESARRTAEWYDAQTVKAKSVLVTAEASKTAYEKQTGIVLQDGGPDIESAKLSALAAASAASAAPVIAGPSASAMQLAQIDASIAQASRVLGPNHPDLIAMRQQRAVMAQQVAQERSAVGAMAGANAVSAGALERQKNKVIGQRDQVERLRQLQAEVDLRRSQFEKAAARTAELRQEAEVGETNLVPLGSAVTPQNPSFPNIPLIMFGALGFGLGFGVLVSLLIELFGRRVRGAEDVTSIIDAPLLAVIAGPRKPPSFLGMSLPTGGARGPARRKFANA